MDFLVPDGWVRLGGWFGHVRPAVGPGAEQAGREALVLWLDHHPLRDGRYRLSLGSDAVSATAGVDYRRVGPLPRYRRIDRDRSPYVCPHCGTGAGVDDHASDVVREWCRACGRFRDGCGRDDDERDRALSGHVPPTR